MKKLVFLSLLSILVFSVIFSSAQNLTLTASPQWVNLGDLDLPGNQLTIEAMIYVTGGSVNVVSKHTSPSDVNYLFRPTTFELSTYVSGNSGATQFFLMSNPYPLLQNKWYHIAGTYDGAFIRYYVNGCLVIEQAGNGNLVQNNLATAIGTQSNCQCEQFRGDIDEVRIWNVARTQAEIQQNMTNLANPTTFPNLLAYYKFSNNLVNAQGNATWNGTMVGAGSFTNNANPLPTPFGIVSAVITNPNCNGVTNGSVTLTATEAGSTYSRNGGAYQASGTFSSLGPATYTFNVRSPEGCVLDTILTLAQPAQVALTASSNTPICTGNNLLLSVNSVVNAQYTWSGPNGFSSLLQNPTINSATTAASGTYSVSALVNGCPTSGSTTSVVVNPIYTATVAKTICPNASYTLPDGVVVNAGGNYTSTLSTIAGCDSVINTTITVALINVNAGNNVGICLGDSTPLNATGGFIYNWTPTTGLSNPAIANPVAKPTISTLYTVSTQVEIGNSIVNGNFNSGNSGFTSSYTYAAINTAAGQYNVGTNAQLWNGLMANCGDHTTGTGNMMQVNGATAPNVSFWCQSVAITPNTTYAFSTWLMTLSVGNPAQLQFSINGTLIGAVFTADNNTCNWQQFYTTWNSGATSTANICIVNQNTLASANDFAIDDISFSALCTATDTVRVIVNPIYSRIVDTAICQNQTYLLPRGTTTATAGTYRDTLNTMLGCDSIIVTNLTVYPTYSATINTSICAGRTYTFPDGTTSTATLTHTSNLNTVEGCDSIIITNLIVDPIYTINVSQTICPSDFYVLPTGAAVNTSGIYRDTMRTAGGCDTLIITDLNVVPPSIFVSNDTAICIGESVQLNASGGLYTYSWLPTTGLSDAAIANPIATPSLTTSYIVTTQVASGDLIANGNFDSGNTGFASSYVYTNDITPEGTYNVGPNPITYHPGFSACPDHTTGTGNMMILNGSGTANTSVWCQTINVFPNTNYAFGCWAESVAAGNPAVLQFSINGGLLGAPFTVPLAVCQWQQFYSLWNSGASTTANICIVNQNTQTGGNDFAIDDISFIGLCDVKDTVTITVRNLITTNITASICQGTSYTFAGGNTSTIAVIDTAMLLDRFGCDSTVITNLSVTPSPIVNVFDTICSNQTYTLPLGQVVTATGIYYDTLSTTFLCDSVVITNLTVYATSSVTVLDTICNGTSYTLPDGSTVTTANTYPVTLTNQYGCDSLVTTVLTVIQITLAQQTVDVLCNGRNTGRITAVATNGLAPYSFNLVQGGSVLFTNANGLFTAVTAGTYTVDVTDNFGCTATVTSTITEPSLLVITDVVDNVNCFGETNGSVTITAVGGVPTYSYNFNNQTINGSGFFDNLIAGNYNYTVTDNNNCTATSSTLVTEPQEILLTISPASATVDLGQSIQLNASSNYDPTATYVWTPSFGLSCSTCPNPLVTLNSSAEYSVLTSVSINGTACTAETEVPITIIPNYELFIPNVFSPNQDGANDYFQIFGNLAALRYVDVQLFNRIGEKVFESNDLNFKWDGKYKGVLLTPTVLVYTIKIAFADNYVPKLYTGSLTILR